MNERDVITTLKLARYKILVAVRPLTGAREAFNMVVAEFASMFAEPSRSEINALKLQEVIA